MQVMGKIEDYTYRRKVVTGVKFKEWKQIWLLGGMTFFLEIFFLGPVVVFFYQQRGLNYSQILSLESVLVLFIFLFEVPTGIFADKFGRKQAIVLGSLLKIVEMLVYLYAQNYWFFVLSFALAGISISLFSGTVEALIYDYLKIRGEEKLMQKAMGNYWAAATMASVISPVLGSWIARDLSAGQFRLLLYLTFGLNFVGIVLSFLIQDTRGKEVLEENPFALLKEGIGILRQNQGLKRLVALNIFTTPFTYSLAYLVQPYFMGAGVPVAYFGVLVAAASMLSAVVARYAYRTQEIFGVRRGLFVATVLPGVLYFALAVVFHPIGSVALYLVMRMVMAVKMPIFSDYINRQIPSKIRSTMLSMISLLVSFYLIFMRLLIGWLAEWHLSYAFILMGGVVLAAAVILRVSEVHVQEA